MIKIENMSFTYNKKVDVFADYSANIGSGINYIVGSNGSGKSTLIKLIMGILKPNKGSIILDDKDVSSMKLSEVAKHNGYLFQNPDNMLFANTVYEELAFALRLQGEKEDNIKEKVKDILKFMKLYEKKDNFPLTLSIGQRQRLALATIFMREPKRLLLDEPTSRLDSYIKNEFYELIRKFNRMGKDIIIATHDYELIDNIKGNIIKL